MRIALLILTLMIASLAGSMGAGAEFNCFQTPGEGIRCACIGASDCSEMRNSGSCKSEAECDKGELGAIVCSCKAARTPKADGRRPMLLRRAMPGRLSLALGPQGPLVKRDLEILPDALREHVNALAADIGPRTLLDRAFCPAARSAVGHKQTL